MKKVFTRVLGLFCAASFVFLVACSNTASNSSETPESIRIGFFPNITHAQALYGQANGSFEEAFAEVDLEWLQFNAGPSEIEAMFAGEVDMGYIGPTPAINANIKSNGDVLVIAGASDGGSILVTRPDLVLDSPKELDGLKLAVPQLGNTQHVLLLGILKEYGLQTTDKGGKVELVASENADTKALLDRGEVDAALLPEPWGARMVNEVHANILLDEKEIWRDGNYPVALVIVNKDFMEAHPDLVQTFLKTHLAVTEEINADPDAAQTAINKKLLELTNAQLDESVMSDAFSRVDITSNITEESVDAFAEMMESAGLVGNGSADKVFVDTSVLENL